jgi:hypothetical protein
MRTKCARLGNAQVREPGPATLPRWGSRVRVPSSAPAKGARWPAACRCPEFVRRDLGHEFADRMSMPTGVEAPVMGTGSMPRGAGFPGSFACSRAPDRRRGVLGGSANRPRHHSPPVVSRRTWWPRPAGDGYRPRRLHRALAQAARWKWIWLNQASNASTPRVAPAEVRPPSPDQVAVSLEWARREDRMSNMLPPSASEDRDQPKER